MLGRDGETEEYAFVCVDGSIHGQNNPQREKLREVKLTHKHEADGNCCFSVYEFPVFTAATV